ncbi:GIY-YIG nuclease family protein [Porphyromonas sp.]|uniref:GIY-YIG nuclease family protein n=1 Tax=Porphyromonas sp. TaxID=1924944 RepID=UPI0026DAD147|nr:GIY-YIG nuclease family protein [Porphyromonas sp.]MDO4770834.1 GIY-YIG nuclease family protein [Porphyromonas sp.]
MGKTVTTYLVDGDPKGTQYAFISNKICQMYVIPRFDIKYLDKQDKLRKPAFYILIGENEETKPQAYIGETENFRERVKDHEDRKTFWQKALIFVSKDADMTKADVQYLEHKAIAEARLSNTFILNENKQIPKAPNLPEYQRDAMDEFFDDVKFLASFIGCNIFETIKPKEEHIFYTKGKDCDAKGFYNSSGFVVLKGSQITAHTTKSFSWSEKRARTINKFCSCINEKVIVHTDITFTSPSTAAAFCLGRSSNGWTEWKDENYQTLDTIYRKQLE